jgi:hypothetical protein
LISVVEADFSREAEFGREEFLKYKNKFQIGY